MYRIYDCYGKSIAFEKLVSKRILQNQLNYIDFKHDNYFFFIKFPFKRQIWNSINLWFISSLVVMIVILFFGYALYVVFKQKMLSEVQRDFVNNMTHEFRTPLTSISLASEILKNSSFTFSPERVLNYVTIINKEAAILENHVEQILQMSYSDREKIKLNKEEVDVNEVILKVIDKFKGIHNTAIFNINLSAKNHTISADIIHFTNILDNLIDNAIKYSPNSPELEISTYNTNNKIFVKIKDNGIGIELEHHKKIFNNFYRIVNGNLQNVKGFGLGLYYVKLMTKAHNGDIKLLSKIGVGSEFIISFSYSI